MAVAQQRTVLQASVTKTAAFTPAGNGVDVSGISGDWTITIHITSLTGTARLAVQDSVDNFTGNLPGPSIGLVGPLTKGFTRNIRKRDWQAFRCGTTSATAKLVLAQCTGSITYDAYITV